MAAIFGQFPANFRLSGTLARSAKELQCLSMCSSPKLIFKASVLRADAFYKSKCPSVCPSVCLFVCMFTFEVPFKRLFAPTSWSRMSNIVKDSESLEKSSGKKWSQIWTYLFENCLKSPRKKKSFFVFVADFALQNMVKTMLPDGLETSGRRAYRYFGISLIRFWVFAFWMIFFRFSKQIGFLGILGPTGNHAFRWIRDLWLKGISLILACL